MDFAIKIVVLIILMGSLQGLFLSYILASKDKFKKKSNLYLAIFILAFSLSNLHYVAHIYGLIQQYSWLNYLTFPWTFLIPIAFYFFTTYLLKPDYQLSKWDKWLYTPFIAQFIFHMALFLMDFFDMPLLHTFKELIFFLDIKLETILSLLINLLFIPLIYKMIRDYEVNLKDNYSEISQSSIQWLKVLLTALIGIWILWALPAIYQVVTGITTPLLDLVLWSMMSICIYWIGYATYLRSDIFFAEQSFPSLEIQDQTARFKQIPRIEKEVISTSKKEQVKKEPTVNKIEEHYERMVTLIEEEKLYTNPEFNLSMLAEKCELSANYLSQIINKNTGYNFYTLINDYRVEEVKTILHDPDFAHYSILSIGLEAGFKSKSSFYKVFKEKVGMTPSQYQKQ